MATSMLVLQMALIDEWRLAGASGTSMSRDERQDNNLEGTVAKSGITAPRSSFSTVLDGAARVLERVIYDEYGQARLIDDADLNADGLVNSADETIFNNNYSSTDDCPRPGDLDRDGIVFKDDDAILQAATGTAYGFGRLSGGTDNIIGWCGYVFNHEMDGSGMYTVRFRHYRPGLGRWVERDPVGYIDGMHMYEYVRSQSLTALDPTGLLQDPGWVRLREIQMLEELKDDETDDDEDCGKKCRHFIIVQWPTRPDRVNRACWAIAHPYPGDAIQGTSVQVAVQEILNSLEEDECICSIQFWSHGGDGFFRVGNALITKDSFGADSHFAPLKDKLCGDGASITVGACRSFNLDQGRELAEAMAAFFQCRVGGYTQNIGEGYPPQYPGYVELCPGDKAQWPDGSGVSVKPKPKGKAPKPVGTGNACCPNVQPPTPMSRDTANGPRV